MSSSSSVSGIMSKRVIMSGDRVAIFLIKRSPRSAYYLDKAQTSFVSNEGTNVLYDNVALPIFGKVCDFANIVEVDESLTTKALEKRFNMSIIDILEMIGNDPIEELKGVSLCFEHESVFKKMVEVDRVKSRFDDYTFTFPVLEHLGFVKTEVRELEDNYLIYKHPDMEGIEAHANSYHTKFFKDGKEEKGLYLLKNILSFLGLENSAMNGIVWTDSYLEKLKYFKEYTNGFEKDINRKSKYEEIVFMEVEKLAKEGKSTKEISEMLPSIVEDLKKSQPDLFKKETPDDPEIVHERKSRYYNTLMEEKGMYNLLDSDCFNFEEEAVKDMWHFKAAMHATSSIFIPTMSGYNDTVPMYQDELLDVLMEMK